jgi:hypothetical protein
MGHCRFLHANHHLRYDTHTFDDIELESAPVPLSGSQIFELTKNISTNFGKGPNRKKPRAKKRKEGEPLIIWKRNSIWFKLPYWKDLKIHHNFDIMHIEKNMCDNIINTLLAIEGKTKDILLILMMNKFIFLLHLMQWNQSRGHSVKFLKVPCFLPIMHLIYVVMCMPRREI